MCININKNAGSHIECASPTVIRASETGNVTMFLNARLGVDDGVNLAFLGRTGHVRQYSMNQVSAGTIPARAGLRTAALGSVRWGGADLATYPADPATAPLTGLGDRRQSGSGPVADRQPAVPAEEVRQRRKRKRRPETRGARTGSQGVDVTDCSDTRQRRRWTYRVMVTSLSNREP